MLPSLESPVQLKHVVHLRSFVMASTTCFLLLPVSLSPYIDSLKWSSLFGLCCMWYLCLCQIRVIFTEIQILQLRCVSIRCSLCDRNAIFRDSECIRSKNGKSSFLLIGWLLICEHLVQLQFHCANGIPSARGVVYGQIFFKRCTTSTFTVQAHYNTMSMYWELKERSIGVIFEHMRD